MCVFFSCFLYVCGTESTGDVGVALQCTFKYIFSSLVGENTFTSMRCKGVIGMVGDDVTFVTDVGG